MYLKVLACDLDGTLARDGAIEPETWQALERAKAAGSTLVLVTGRTLAGLAPEGPFSALFDAVVAEDGAAIYFPRNDSVTLPFGRLAPRLVERLERSGIPLERGAAIVATWTPHDRTVLDILRETGGSGTIEYNKGAVMVLPPGATKGTGLRAALDELGFSPRNVLAFGDAENDRSLFETAEMAVAVANAHPDIRDLADLVLTEPNGAGVRAFLERARRDSFFAHPVRPRRELRLGDRLDGGEVRLAPWILLMANLGVFGASESGKSWLAGLLAEELLREGYQVFLVDPEGDYQGLRAFPHTLHVGGPDAELPPVAELATLCEYANLSVILDLSGHLPAAACAYVTELLPALHALRRRRGRPHWLLVDEAHAFCPAGGGGVTAALRREMDAGGVALVSYRPSCVAAELLDRVDHWMLTRLPEDDEAAALGRRLPPATAEAFDPAALAAAPPGQAWLFLSPRLAGATVERNPVRLRASRRTIPHVRHLHKYLKTPLPPDKRFYFEGGAVAANLGEFCDVLERLPLDELDRHLARGDLERWLGEVLQERSLARRVGKIRRRELDGDALRAALVAAVANRYRELESLI